jgi:hypothetical protein
LDAAECALAIAWIALFAVLGALSVRSVRRALVGALLAGAVGVAVLSNPAEARLVFVQGHNVVALVLWIYLYRRQRRSLAVPLVLIGSGSVLLASGIFYGVTLHHGQATAFGVHVLAASDWLAPGLRADHAIGMTSAFVFLQSVHYAV